MFGGAYWALQSSKVQTYLTQRLGSSACRKKPALKFQSEKWILLFSEE
jgi:hypothetical protein